MTYTSDHASRAMEKELKHRKKATKATLQGKPKKAARQGAKAQKQRSKMSY